MNEIGRLRDEINKLEGVLQGVDNNIDFIAEQMANKAILSYPNEASDDGLGVIHARLTELADKIINKMVQVHKDLIEAKDRH